MNNLYFYMNKAFYLLCALTLTVGHATSALAQDTSGWNGSGTSADPYQIAKASDLALLATRVNAYDAVNSGTTAAPEYCAYAGVCFKLTADIDLNGSTFTPIGNNASHSFGGSFNGAGHIISNLSVSGTGYLGLFGHLAKNSIVTDLTIDKANVNGSSYFVGAVVGFSKGTLNNVNVSNSTIYGTSSAVGGIGGTIANTNSCTVTASTVTGLGGYVGGIAGEIADAYISYSHATATTVNGAGATSLPVGGIVGNLSQSNATSCYFTGTVNAAYNGATNLTAGGIAGRAVNCTVRQCFSRTHVTANYSNAYAGGVAGVIYGATISDCYSTGRVECAASAHVGGLVGLATTYTSGTNKYQPAITNSYTAGTIVCNTYQYDVTGEAREAIGGVDNGAELTVSNIYFDNQMANLGSENRGISTSGLTAANGPDGFDASLWTFAQGYYPRLKGIDTNEAALYSASALHLSGTNSISNVTRNAALKALGSTKFLFKKGNVLSTEGYNATISSDTLVMGSTFGADTLCVVNGADTSYYNLNIAPVSFSGDGTQASPFLLQTKEDLVELADLTTNKKVYFPSTYFKVTNDIDMEYTTDFKGICITPDDVNACFEGVIDGDGHTLNHLALTGYVVWTTEPTTGFGDGTGKPKTGSGDGVCKTVNGFIGRLGTTGVLKNLNIAADAKIEFFAQAGTFVGYNLGTIENCKNFATVQGLSSYIGGIAGRNEKGGTIRNCLNAGTVESGYQHAGGITAMSAGIVEGCMNTGYVAVRQLSEFATKNFKFAGGIVSQGSGFIMKNCVNAGTVAAAAGTVGGISATLGNSLSAGTGSNDIYTTINYGTVISSDITTSGAIGGTSGTKGTISKVYWDGQIIPLKAHGNVDLEGAEAATTSTLTSGTAISGFDTSTWNFTAGAYPVLKQFAEISQVKSASQVMMGITAGQTASALMTDATLTAPEGTQWTLTTGTDYEVSGNTLKVPQGLNRLLVDTLTATCGNYMKVIPISTPYELQLSGDGSKESPYLISNANEWLTFANYMTDCDESFAGQYVKVTADIDFTGVDFKPIGNKATSLQADFDGAGHTVKGITYTPADTYEGAFATVGADAVVHDLTVGGTITSAKSYTAGFVGAAYGTFRNCVNAINVTSTATYSAGFVANAYGTAKFEDCINQGNVSSSNTYIGGFASNVVKGASFLRCANVGSVSNTGSGSYTAGFAANSTAANYIGVYNIGEINITNPDKVQYVGGLIGKLTGGTADVVTMTNCYNTADIEATGVIAGLFGTTSSANFILHMDSCYNTGNIHSVTSTSIKSGAAGGIAGFFPSNSTYANCWNSGNVTSDKNQYAGGLVAKNSSSGTATRLTTIKNCHNTGNVVANGSHGAGIAAYIADYTTIDSCYNTGNVSGSNRIAGLVAVPVGAHDVISNCYNSGDVTAATTRAGGLQSYGVATATFTNCFNTGSISSQSTTSGTAETAGAYIGGLAGTSGATFIRCYNAGKVNGVTNVGGLSGATSAGKTAFRNCYNAGEVVAPDNACGGIIGVDPTATTNWKDGNACDSTYYVTDYGTYSYTLGTAVTTLELCSTDLGEGYTILGDYTLPVLNGFANCDVAKLYAAAVAVQPGDVYANVTKGFNVGTEGGVAWTATPASAATIKGNNVLFESPYTGELTLTANLGELTRTLTLNCEGAISTGVDNVTATKQVQSVTYYNTAGQASTKPFPGVNIAVTRYTDGTTSTTKQVVR